MDQVRVISFDADGTLVTPYFTDAIWHEAIPARYAQKWGLSLEEARSRVLKEYQEVGEQRMEWYDIRYWFRRFGFSDHEGLLQSYRHMIALYPEVTQTLSALSSRYQLIVASGAARDFLDLLLDGVQGHFVRVFSSISDHQSVKTPEFYLEICRAMDIEPQEMIHVGDSWDFDFINSQQVGIGAFYLDRKRQRQGERVVGDLLEFGARLLLGDSSPI
jgi:putative hydrolase of the HAD superfamily